MQRWRNLSVATKLYIAIGTMAVLVALELLTLTFAMRTLSAVRGFVGGESLWSKAQKDAAISLQRFAITRKEEDYQAFLKYMTIPEGDHLARIELMKPKPDLGVVRDGFRAGGIHEDDIDPLIDLLKRFHWERHIAKAIATWTEGDRLMSEFRAAGEEYHTLLKSGVPSSDPRAYRAFGRIYDMNARLTAVESEFSQVLGEGSRWLEDLVNKILLGLVLTVECFGLTLTILTSRSIQRGLLSIHEAATALGKGDFRRRAEVTSSDEIGQVAIAINQMAQLLEGSYATLESRVKERTNELSDLAAENARLYSEAKEAVQTRDEFLSVASHELKTPLTALQLRFELLRRQMKDLPAEKQFDQLRDIVEGTLRDTKRLGSLLEELLDLTRIRTGKLTVRRERCDLGMVVLDVARQFGEEAARSRSKLTVNVDGAIQGDFDSLRISQVLTNLISNAIKYGQGTPIRVSARSEGGAAVIEVSDEGRGIAVEDQPRIFDRFERLGADERIGGFGLGLYITRQIVLAHGGQVQLESDPGQGSLFRVTLPKQPPPELRVHEG